MRRFAKQLAEEKGVDLATVVGTGPEGRITAEDVEKAPAGSAPAYKSAKTAHTKVTLSRLRKNDEN